MWIFESGLFEAMFVIVPAIIAIGFIFVILQIVSPRFRGRMMSRQIRSVRHMMDYAKDDLEDIGVTASEVGINVKERVLDGNEDRMRDIASRTAHVTEDAIRTTVGAVADGIRGNRPQVYCKHCGSPIDSDSRFCKHCGQEQ